MKLKELKLRLCILRKLNYSSYCENCESLFTVQKSSNYYEIGASESSTIKKNIASIETLKIASK